MKCKCDDELCTCAFDRYWDDSMQDLAQLPPVPPRLTKAVMQQEKTRSANMGTKLQRRAAAILAEGV